MKTSRALSLVYPPHRWQMSPVSLSPPWTHHSEVNIAHRTKTDVKLRLFLGFVWLGGPETHKHTYYYWCKHVILLSNEPFTVSVMKQLALTQAKLTAESSHVYAARWKQMLRSPNTGRSRPGSAEEQKGTLNQPVSHSQQLIDSIRKSWIPLVKHRYVRTTPNWAMTNWPWMNPQIDFFPPLVNRAMINRFFSG